MTGPRPWSALLLFVLLTLTACGDDGGVARLDAGGPATDAWISPWDHDGGGNVWFDGSAPPDLAPVADASPPPDTRVSVTDSTAPWLDGASPGGQSCDAILTCAQGCMDPACMTTCVSKGSPGAQQQFVALNNCLAAAASGACAAGCNADPLSQACQACLTGTCAGEISACTGGYVPPLPDGGVPADGTAPLDAGIDGPVGPDGGAGLSCDQVLQCIAGCTDQLCFDACLIKGSAAAQSQIKLLFSCLDAAYYGSCVASCANPSSAACDSCLSSACAGQLAACGP